MLFIVKIVRTTKNQRKLMSLGNSVHGILGLSVKMGRCSSSIRLGIFILTHSLITMQDDFPVIS